MAQRLATLDIVPDFSLGSNVVATEVAAIIETDAEPIGVGADTPWVAIFVKVQSSGSARNLGNSGRLRVALTYEGNTAEALTLDAAPFSAFGAIATAGEWAVVRADGKCRRHVAPTADTVVAQSASDSARERIAIDAGKSPATMNFWWTDDD